MGTKSRKGWSMIATVLILSVVAFMAYVRFSPLPPERWHRPIEASADADLAGGAVRVLPGDAALFARLDRALSALPRTRVLAGSPETGRITYVTRSAAFGFPDLTTLEQHGDTIRLYARLRFGASDMGVNATRLERLLDGIERG